MKNNKNIGLEEIGKELPFSVPENYFNQFALQMDGQIGFRKPLMRKNIRTWLSMAAMFVGILIIGQIFYTVNQNNATRNAEKYEAYVLSQVNENSLVDLYVDEVPSKSTEK
jgi:multidrug resistance efflux pump